jgi:endoglucanase
MKNASEPVARRGQIRAPWALVLTVALVTLQAGCKTGAAPAGGKVVGVPVGAAPPPLVGHNLIYNESFNEGTKALPWTASFSAPGDGHAVVENGELCIEVTNKGVNRWDAHLRQQHLVLQKGHTYHVQFKMHATQKTRAYLKIGQAGPPYHEFWKLLYNLDTTPKVFSGTFTMMDPDDPGVEMAFHVGGMLAKTATVPFKVCVDDARIDDPQFTPKPEELPPPIPAVLVNQVGYFPRLDKLAVVKNPAAVGWELRNAQNQVVASGTTVPFGPDPASGDKVSVADFSAYTTEGSGYTLKVGADVSHPFDIRPDIYGKLKYDALAFYYQQRSGIPIELPYAGDPTLVRAAGHIDVPPNKGDKHVPCAPGSGCTYSLDVSGGWYDAGDQGKYVVNAGISVWTLLNWWERTQHLGSSAADFGDGKMNIPENKNGVPDLLDEARWELEFEMKMQVPEGEKLAGMAHHKVHDLKWAPDTMAPADDPIERYLQPPSTAATLNLAANGAQCARVWHHIDKAFAAKCLAAAERAWDAAKANPAIYAPEGGEGGGPYDDKDVTDDFYWAATELYITTKKPELKELITKSEHFKKVTKDWDDNPGIKSSMTWADTRALGSISLAIVPNGIDRKDIEEIKKNIAARGDDLLDVISKQGYRMPFGLPAKGYPWGSTSFVLNNSLILALANDFTHEAKYLNGVAMGMDYILGRNAIDQSYITGYGERALQNPYVQGAGLKGCAPQKCFLDNGGAWSVNEVTINWNAPLVWVTSFLDEKANAKTSAAGATPTKGKSAK